MAYFAKLEKKTKNLYESTNRQTKKQIASAILRKKNKVGDIMLQVSKYIRPISKYTRP